MGKSLIQSGIDIIKDVPWGTHICQFYETKEDLTEILVPYFKAGLENNEFCMWVTSQPLDVEEAKKALRKAVSDFDVYFEKGQIEIIPHTQWYLKEGIFDSERILNSCIDKLNHSHVTGYDGLRLSGNMFWLEKTDWNNFVDHEKKVDSVIDKNQMVALCTYSLERCSAAEIIDAVINHQFSLIKREGKWEQIESSRRKETAILQSSQRKKEEQEHVRTEEALHKNREDLDRAQAVGNIGSWRLDVHKNELTWSDENHRIFGIQKGTPLTYETFLSTVHPDDRKYVDKEWRAGLEGKPYDIEHRIIANDKIKWVREKAYLEFDKDGALICGFGITQDITERKQAEEAVLRSEERFRTLAENSPDVIVRFDRQKHHIYSNPAASEPYGKFPEEIIGKTNSELGMDSEKVKFWEEHYENVFTAGKPEIMDFQHISPQGKKYYFNTRIVPEFVDGEVSSVLAISRDITDIKEVEAELKETLDNLEKLVKERTMQLEKAYKSLSESEKGLAEAQEMAHIGNWDLDLVTGELNWSDETYRIFGLIPQAFDLTYDKVLSYVHPEDRDYVENSIKETFNGRLYDIDYRIILANGEERVVHTRVEVTFDEKNNPVRMRGTVQDITKRKQMEAALELVARLPQENPDPVIRLNQGLVINYANSASQVLLTDWGSTVNQEAPVEITEMAVAALGDGIRRKLECNYADHTYLINIVPFPQSGYVNLYASDISERKRAEEMLKKSERKLKALFELLPVGVSITDKERNILDVNLALENILGLSRSDLFSGMHGARKYLRSNGTEMPFEEFPSVTALKKKGSIQSAEMGIIKEDGSIIWTDVSAIALPFSDEQVVITTRDITENKKAEEKLQTLANAVESSDDAILTRSLDGIITSWNKGAEQIYGYMAEEILGKNVSILEPDNLKEEMQQVVEKIKQGGRIRHYETLRLKKDGTIINISITLSPVFDTSGKLVAISTVSRDVTEKNKAEEVIKLSNIYNRSLIEASLDPLVTIGPDGKITDANGATEAITGYYRGELIGTDFSYYFTEPERAKEVYKQVFREGLVRDYELEIQHRDGHITPVLYNARVYRDQSGKVIGVFAAARDITERKMAEEAMDKMDKIRIKEIHHRIKNNLQVISSLLSLEAERFSDAKMLEAFRESQNRVISMALIHEELYKGGGLDTLDFAAYLRKLTADLFSSYNLEKDNINIILDFEQVFLDMDNAIPLGIIVNELVSNSLKHAFPAGRKGEIHITLCKTGTYTSRYDISCPKPCSMEKNCFNYILTVTDNGKGISEEIEFQNADSLGLQLVGILVEQIDSCIELKRDHGTEVTIWFNKIEI
jgi:PAS domain S-box-containing protein